MREEKSGTRKNHAKHWYVRKKPRNWYIRVRLRSPLAVVPTLWHTTGGVYVHCRYFCGYFLAGAAEYTLAMDLRIRGQDQNIFYGIGSSADFYAPRIDR